MRTLNPSTHFLDRLYHGLAGRDPGRALPSLFEGLQEVRERSTPTEWESFARAAQEHGLRGLVHEDPMTRRSFEKPRGYAGDAVLLDYIYRDREPDAPTERGQAVYAYAAARPASCAVRHRRDLLAHLIDRTADRVGDRARVLSVACGHLREARLSVALQAGRIEELVALDADPESLAVVGAEPCPAIRPVERSIGRLLARPGDLGRFDFAYSAGLYDYLEDSLARRLTAALFGLLRPGGRLLICNFLPTVPDSGYMATYMGWSLIYRDLPAIEALAAGVPDGEVAARRFWSDAFGAIGYLELQRAR